MAGYKRKSYKSKSKRTFKRKLYRKSKSNASFKRRVKAAVMRIAEPKKVSLTHGKAELYHNVPGIVAQLSASTAMPAQGVADSQRIGDQINALYFDVKMLCGQKSDRENVTWKFWVVKVPKGAGYTYATWFDPVTNNCMLDDMNEDFVKVVMTRIVKYNVSLVVDAGEEFTFPYRLRVPFKKLVKFGPANGAVTNSLGHDYHLVAAVYDAYGTNITDNIAYMQIVSSLHYRDP